MIVKQATRFGMSGAIDFENANVTHRGANSERNEIVAVDTRQDYYEQERSSTI